MRINKKYKSLDELNRDIMLTKLQADISKEEIRLATLNARHEFKPVEMTSEFVSTYLKRTLTTKAISLALGWVRTWRYRRNR